MRRFARSSLCAATWLVACASVPTHPRPRDFAVLHTEAIRQWWDSTAACTGQVGDFNALRLYVRVVLAGTGVLGDRPDSTGEVIAAYTTGDVVVVGMPWATHGDIWRHEFAHVLTHTTNHPAEIFQRRCKRFVFCAESCMRDSLP